MRIALRPSARTGVAALAGLVRHYLAASTWAAARVPHPAEDVER
jgi:hypothetical protein